MSTDKKYTFNIQANVVGEDGVEMFDAHVTYKNMAYGDVVLVEKAIVGMFGGLNEYAEARVSPAKTAPGQLKK